MKSAIQKTLCFSILALLSSIAQAGAEEFRIAPGEENSVRFVSKAPMETVEGKTHAVSGSITANLADLAAGVAVDVQVDLASIDTGIKLRNQHMCQNHLETDQYPHATFHATELLDAPAGGIPAGGSASFTLKGEFTLHGVTRTIEIPITAALAEDRGERRLLVSADFEVKLADYEIPRPKFLVLKLDEVQRLSVELVAHPLDEEG